MVHENNLMTAMLSQTVTFEPSKLRQHTKRHPVGGGFQDRSRTHRRLALGGL
jgi:hypothetical protein